TSDDGRSIDRVGYVAGDRIVPSRRPWAGASRLVRARSADPPVLCARRLRPSARHLEAYGRSNGGVWRPPPNVVGRTAGAGDPRRTSGPTVGRTAESGDPRQTSRSNGGVGRPRPTKRRMEE